MTDANTRFCRILLRVAMRDLTGRELAHFKANAFAMRVSRGQYLFEWVGAALPGTYTLELQADNANHAKAQGISKWLEHVAERARTAGWPPREL